jgi:hypothetical protein
MHHSVLFESNVLFELEYLIWACFDMVAFCICGELCNILLYLV